LSRYACSPNRAKRRSKGISEAVTATGARPEEKYQYVPAITAITPNKMPASNPLIIDRSAFLFEIAPQV